MLPPLRHFVTSLLKERLFVRLPLRGAGGVAVCGVALFSFRSYLPLWRPMIAPTNIKFCVRNGALDIPFFVPYPNAPRISVGATIGRPIALTLRGAGNAVDCGVALPPLRHFVTPLLKERLFAWLPLRGAVNAVDCGVALISIICYSGDR